MSGLQPTLINCSTSDNLLLPGLLFEPKEKSSQALVCLHGNGGSSILRYNTLTRAFAEELNKLGIAYFPFNNRGAGYISKIDLATPEKGKSSKRYGMAYELIKECIEDIDAVITTITEYGYTDISLIGFSTGANKICVYNYYKPENSVKKYILACGGDDTGLYYDMWGEERFNRLLEESQLAIEQGNASELIPEFIAEGFPISYQSLFDTINPDGDYNIFPYFELLHNQRLGNKQLLREFSSIVKPTLAIYGSEDEYSYGKVPEIINLLKTHSSTPETFDTRIISGADHGFKGKEKELAKQVGQFLCNHL